MKVNGKKIGNFSMSRREPLEIDFPCRISAHGEFNSVFFFKGGKSILNRYEHLTFKIIESNKIQRQFSPTNCL